MAEKNDIYALSPEDVALIIRLIQERKPLPSRFLPFLFSLPETGTFFWPEKQERIPFDRSSVPAYNIPQQWGEVIESSAWSNVLFQGDNLMAMEAMLLPKVQTWLTAHGGIRFLYADPPFAVGTDFFVTDPVHKKRDAQIRNGSFAYSDKWGKHSDYFNMVWPRLQRMYDLLSEDGCLCLHCDWRTTAPLRLMLDELFGPKHFLNEIIWHYTGGGRSRRYFSRKHDTLLLYAKGDTWTFLPDAIRVPYKPTSGYARSGITSKAGKRYLPNPDGTLVDDVWDFPIVNPMAKERTGYATQKPLRLLKRILEALTKPEDIVADFFCGSGTTLVAAQGLQRKWIGCDKGAEAIRIAMQRIEETGTSFLQITL